MVSSFVIRFNVGVVFVGGICFYRVCDIKGCVRLYNQFFCRYFIVDYCRFMDIQEFIYFEGIFKFIFYYCILIVDFVFNIVCRLNDNFGVIDQFVFDCVINVDVIF